MNIEEARLVVLRRFLKAARTSDISDEGLLDDWSGSPSDLVLALRDAGLLEHVRGRSKGAVYKTTKAGERFVAEPPPGA